MIPKGLGLNSEGSGVDDVVDIHSFMCSEGHGATRRRQILDSEAFGLVDCCLKCVVSGL